MTTLETKPLKCISVAQPWPWAIFNGKDFENRTWHSGRFTGPLLIHASKSIQFESGIDWLRNEGFKPPPFTSLHKGFIVGIVHQIGCWHINHIKTCPVPRTVFADGPYCHVYQQQTAFKHPIPYRGQQGIYNVDIEIVRSELNALPLERKRYFRDLYKKWCEL